MKPWRCYLEQQDFSRLSWIGDKFGHSSRNDSFRYCLRKIAELPVDKDLQSSYKVSCIQFRPGQWVRSNGRGKSSSRASVANTDRKKLSLVAVNLRDEDYAHIEIIKKKYSFFNSSEAVRFSIRAFSDLEGYVA